MIKMLEKIEFRIRIINNYVIKIASLLSFLTITLMVGIVLISVFFRYVLNYALGWTEELSKFLMVWMTLMAAPIALYYGKHIGIQTLINVLRAKPKYNYAVILLGYISIFLLLGVIIKEGIEWAWIVRVHRASSVDLPIFWVYLSIPFGSMMMFTVSFEQFIVILRKLIENV